MPAELVFSPSILIAFLLVLSRMTGVFIFVPLPLKGAGPGSAKIFIAIACTLSMFARWPSIDARQVTFGVMVVWLISEMALGVSIGLMVSFIAESLTIGAQILSLQAGYAYASVVDPSTQADSEVLAVLAQLIAGLLFFTTGLHRSVISAFATSLDRYPPGSFLMNSGIATNVVHLGANIFSVGLRLAFPILGLLLMTEISLGLLGRINSQLQLGIHAFPIKMLITLAVLASILAVAPSLYAGFAAEVFRNIGQSLAR